MTLQVRSEQLLVGINIPDSGAANRLRATQARTVDILEQTAITVVDDDELGQIKEEGFSFRILDQYSEFNRYAVIHTDRCSEVGSDGELLWQGKQTAIIKVFPSNLRAFSQKNLRHRKLPDRPISDRVWNALTTTYTVNPPRERTNFIQNLIDQVQTDSLMAIVQRLQDFETRLMLTDSCIASAEWIHGEFERLGYAAQYDSYFVNGSWVGDFPGTGFDRSVVANRMGNLNPDEQVIMGGHYDSIVWPNYWDALTWAPGADDNATGVACALEAARIFTDHAWDRTLTFIAFGGEELGLFGSTDYASESDSLGRSIRGVINMDMIAYMDGPDLDLNIGYAPISNWLAELFEEVGSIYVPELTLYPVLSFDGSDHAPFNAMGIPAIAGEERWIPNNPHWHAPTDIIDNISPALFTLSTKVAVATMAIVALAPDQVADVAVTDVGDGESVHVSWTPGDEIDIIGYRIFWRMTDEEYSEQQSFLVSGADSYEHSLEGYTEDTVYHFLVVAEDNDGFQSYIGIERTIVPSIEPMPCAGVEATPLVSGIRVSWDPNTELDLEGYRVYRRMGDESEYTELTSSLIVNNVFEDTGIPFGDYYYSIRAYDEDGNASDFSDEAFSRPITLDQGILVVDETRNYSTLPDETQNEFYAYLVKGFDTHSLEYGLPEERPQLADLGPYSTVLWFSEDFSEYFAHEHIDDFVEYLESGGNVIFVGWKPTADLTGDEDYPYYFTAGDFMYDYMGISSVDITLSNEAVAGVHSMSEYPDMQVNPDYIVVPSWGGTLRYAEGMVPVGDAEVLYTLDMVQDTNDFEGSPCALIKTTANWSTVFFGLPLYYMVHSQAQIALRSILQDLGESFDPTRIDDQIPLVHSFELAPNTPNPFSQETTFRFSLPLSGEVHLTVYDISGRAVNTLLDGVLRAGTHSVVWDGTNNSGEDVGNGIYFCQLHAGASRATHKVLVLR